jgi:nucleoid-associated protein YgaU
VTGDLCLADLVMLCAAVVLCAAVGWLLVAALLTLATQALRCGHTTAGRLARAITPALVHTLVSSACGAALLTAPAAPTASAAPPDEAAAGARALPVPDRPVLRPPSTRPPSTRSPGAGGGATVRIRRGDTLWSIAARHLPATASDGEIAGAWPTWFRRNRGRLGPDPHLIHPGTRLRVPPRFR